MNVEFVYQLRSREWVRFRETKNLYNQLDGIYIAQVHIPKNKNKKKINYIY